MCQFCFLILGGWSFPQASFLGWSSSSLWAFSAAFATSLASSVSKLGRLHSCLSASLGAARYCPVMHLRALFVALSSLSLWVLPTLASQVKPEHWITLLMWAEYICTKFSFLHPHLVFDTACRSRILDSISVMRWSMYGGTVAFYRVWLLIV